MKSEKQTSPSVPSRNPCLSRLFNSPHHISLHERNGWSDFRSIHDENRRSRGVGAGEARMGDTRSGLSPLTPPRFARAGTLKDPSPARRRAGRTSAFARTGTGKVPIKVPKAAKHSQRACLPCWLLSKQVAGLRQKAELWIRAAVQQGHWSGVKEDGRSRWPFPA